MYASTIFVALTLALSQATLDVSASSAITPRDDYSSAKPAPLPGGPKGPSGEGNGSTPDVAASPNSVAAPAPGGAGGPGASSPDAAGAPPVSSGDGGAAAPGAPAGPAGGSPAPADQGGPPSTGDAAAPGSSALPGASPTPDGTAVSATSKSPVPGDMSSGQCMCPAPPTCAAGGGAEPSPKISDPTSKSPDPTTIPEAGGAVGSDTVSAGAAFVVPEGKMATGLFAAALTFFAL